MKPARYLAAARRRLRALTLLRGGAASVLALLALTALLAWLIMVLVPAPGTVVWLRLLLYLALAAGIGLTVWWRGRRVQATLLLERQVPEFGGRLATWADAYRRGDQTPLLVLLTEQTRRIAERHPVERVIPGRWFAWPAAAAGAGVLLLGLLLAGNHPWQLAAQRLWAGDLLADAQPRILVAPGDTVVRRGSDVIVDARARGFRPDTMDVHASFDDGIWERAPMSRLNEDGYSFIFVGVTEALEYYVSARGLTSTRHRIRVADLPHVTEVTLDYRYPDWTGLEDSRRSAGDVTALPGTRVGVTASSDRPLGEAVLVVNGEAQPMTGRGSEARGAFEVTAPGEWHVAVRHEGALARISDSYLITVAEDAAPEVTYFFPGHDRKATPIEEVAVGFEAKDDYAVEGLVMRYAVNGGDWQEVSLDAPRGEHVVRLEDLQAMEGRVQRPLQAGDVLTLYGEARDHTQFSRTSLYFVDVRPFDMRYHESQQMAGQGASEGGGLDIAERQRDILSATWNLINKQDRIEPQTLADEADVLAMLQRDLRDQVETLLMRSQARGLGSGDEVAEFLQELAAAVEHMEPAAARLEAHALMDAVPSEQQALRHLVTAESTVRDVDVSLSRSNGRGTAGQSLSELIELEMDPERNRYEMPQQPGLGEAAPAEENKEWERLRDLAARQERLARQQSRNPESLPSRWEQARLERELEALRQDMENRAAQAANASSAEGARSTERALSDLRAAQRALEEAPGDPQAQQRASEALRSAAETLRQEAFGNLQERLAEAERRASNLEADQERVMEALQELQQSALEQARSGRGLNRSDYAMQTFAEVKRRMQEDLAGLRREMTEIGEALGGRDPEGAQLLEQALRELDKARVDERLAASAEAFEMGQPLYVIGSESLVEQALEQLGRRIRQAGDAAGDDIAEGSDPLEEVRSLRRRLTDARRADGSLAERQVTDVARSLAQLTPDADDGGGLTGARTALDDDGIYETRGTASENTEALYRMTLERLDLIEASLETADSPPIRAEEPRDAGRDSAAAARYFRDLSRSHQEDDGR